MRQAMHTTEHQSKGLVHLPVLSATSAPCGDDGVAAGE